MSLVFKDVNTLANQDLFAVYPCGVLRGCPLTGIDCTECPLSYYHSSKAGYSVKVHPYHTKNDLKEIIKVVMDTTTLLYSLR